MCFLWFIDDSHTICLLSSLQLVHLVPLSFQEDEYYTGQPDLITQIKDTYSHSI